MSPLADEARALLAATAEMADDKVRDARQRLANALEHGRELYGRARGKVIDGARTADHAVHEHPYQAIGLSLGIGAALGYLLARRSSRKNCD